jgi:superfamily II DNA/RNA helicase
MFKQRFVPRHKQSGRSPRKHGSVSEQALRQAIAAVKVIGKKQQETAAESDLSFREFGLSALLLKNIEEKGYTIPTPIQQKAIPEILAGKDVTGIANTGTGKTAAFLIPLIHNQLLNQNQKVLIITPTRELAVQIQDELISLTKQMAIRSALLIGGVSSGRQKADITRSPQFVIGTPGRIKDLLGTRSFTLSVFNTVVLDEADRMVDIGFINDISYFISLLPKNRQSLFFSATIDGKVKEILQRFVHNPTVVSVQKQQAAESIEQTVVEIHPHQKKIDVLHDLLIQKDAHKVLVFGRTKWGIQKLHQQLEQRGFKTAAIHGNKTQAQRQRALTLFRQGQIQILLATDVASRGLDIEDVSHVINYDTPATMEDYIHRIGRTGRADKKGKAITFVER